MNNNLNTLRSQAMSLANRLRKEHNLTKSDALKTAWAQVKKTNNYQSKAETKIEFKDVNVMSTLEKVQEYERVKQLVDELQKYMDTVKQELINEMEQKQLQELKVDIFKVRYIEVVANRFNTSDFKKTHIDLYNQYLKESRSKRFTIAC